MITSITQKIDIIRVMGLLTGKPHIHFDFTAQNTIPTAMDIITTQNVKVFFPYIDANNMAKLQDNRNINSNR